MNKRHKSRPYFLRQQCTNWVLLATIAVCSAGCGGGSSSSNSPPPAQVAPPPTVAPPATPPYSGSGIVLLIASDSNQSISVLPDEVASKEIFLRLVDSNISFEVNVDSSESGITISSDNGRYSLEIDSSGFSASSAIPVTVTATNLNNGETTAIDLNIEVLEADLVASGNLGPEGGVIASPGGKYGIQIDPGQLSGSIGIQIYVAETETSALWRISFDQDISSHSAEVRLLSNSYVAPAALPQKTNKEVVLTNLGGEAGTNALTYPYPLTHELSRYDGYFFEGYRLQLGRFFLNETPLLSCQPSTGPNTYQVCIRQYFDAATLTSSVNQEELDALRNDQNDPANIAPVLFVHGYTPLNNLGGGEDTWNDFPYLAAQLEVDGRPVVPFEFQWRTNTSFRTAAPDLAGAIRTIYSATGQRVRIVAHSFGGVLTRMLLQNLVPEIENTGFDKQMVASVLTLGTPHSGIFRGLETIGSRTFPPGQDSRLFLGCGQISCSQMGEPLEARPGFLDLMDVGVTGEIASLLYDTSERLAELPRVPMVVAIGLKRESSDNFVYDDGDGLISYRGQRLLGSSEIGLGRCRDFPMSVREVVLGAYDGEFHAAAVGPDSEVLNNSRGYSHSYAPWFAEFVNLDPDDELEFAEPYVECAAGDNTCEHDSFRLFSSILESQDQTFCEDRSIVLNPLEPNAWGSWVTVTSKFGTILQDFTVPYRVRVTGALEIPSSARQRLDSFSNVGLLRSDIDVSGNTIELRFVDSGRVSDGEFSGLEFRFEELPGDITLATLSAESDFSVLEQRVTFSSDTIWVNAAGTFLSSGDFLKIDFNLE